MLPFILLFLRDLNNKYFCDLTLTSTFGSVLFRVTQKLSTDSTDSKLFLCFPCDTKTLN